MSSALSPMVAANNEAAQKAVDALRRQYTAGEAVVLSSTDRSVEGATVRKNYADLLTHLEKWATTWRSWASNGGRPDGSSYTWARWTEAGQQLGKDIAYQTGIAPEASQWAAVGRAIGATVLDVKAKAEDAAQTTATAASWWKVWVPVLVLLVLAVMLAPYAGLAARRK